MLRLVVWVLQHYRRVYVSHLLARIGKGPERRYLFYQLLLIFRILEGAMEE